MLVVIGEVAVKHVHLDHMLKMTIKSLTGVTVDEAPAELSRKGSLVLRKKIEKKAKQRLGDCPDLTRLQELLDRCRNASEQRNFYVKSVYAIRLSEPNVGSRAILGADQIWCPIPSLEEMRKLSVSIESLISEINEARLHGWLRDAIDATRSPAD